MKSVSMQWAALIQGGGKEACPTITIYAWEWNGSEFSLQLSISCYKDMLDD